ncbi:Uncharacterised protein [Mycobacteroides abscessus subsp. abscessus]|nr:Uncharacterised protein [Mycobacteroides abscessus subsp. abscessus]
MPPQSIIERRNSKSASPGWTAASSSRPLSITLPMRSSAIARYRSSLAGKCRYTVPAPTPARRAISSIGTPSPSSAKVW